VQPVVLRGLCSFLKASRGQAKQLLSAERRPWTAVQGCWLHPVLPASLVVVVGHTLLAPGLL